ncbi:5-amino-6-(5-phosphoribosylamino)uracil reductase [Frondihabitans sp. PhB188]|uniref:dihydrofolate reductase family protein n=1 Tax=Frondihabitans sp. PhB188 TaxID=2485200 RepID=UPI000F474C78|nr:dihydrofolate reductase family protein [Frondihabitans sp. PhB188]ROQ41097.1 5-amino-6-(5-phosphoribosylamino)uracil reductase [Frondihabitans sp. PhB188]
MILRLLHRSREAGPDVPTSLEVGCDETQEILKEWYRPPADTWLRINLIAAVSGDAAGVDGTSDSLSNPADRSILRAIRDVADAVVVGAASVRAEGYRVPLTAKLVVVTSSGDLSGHRIAPERADRVVVICPAAALDRVHESLGRPLRELATVLVCPDVAGRLAPADIVEALRGVGLRSLVCEGGPSLAGQFLHDSLVDELCLSTSPIVIGSGLPVFGTERFDASALSLDQLLIDDLSSLYARWKVLPNSAPGEPAASL